MEFSGNIPIYQQIVDLIKFEIVSGKLEMGEKMLSTRDLALKLKVNPNTIQRVYRELENEEVCLTKRGLGTYVTEEREVILSMKESLAGNMIKSFIDGMLKLNYSSDEILNKLKQQLEGEES